MALTLEMLYVKNRSRPLIGPLYSSVHACMFKIAAACVNVSVCVWEKFGFGRCIVHLFSFIAYVTV